MGGADGLPRLIPSEAARVRAGVGLAFALVGLRWAVAARAPVVSEPAPSCGAPVERTEAGWRCGTPIEGLGGLWLGRKLDLNHATAAELSIVPGIGARISERIVEDRERNGAFATLEALERVKGIGPALRRRVEAYAEVRAAP